MNKDYSKIIALFFLTILLTSSVLNLHIFFHDHDHDHYFGNLGDHHKEQKDTPCELCLLVLNFSDLDYNNSLEFSYESDIQIINNFRKDLLIHKKLYYNQLFSEHNKNKAPPHLS
ncbi:hypothetical protein [Winogradskyella sp.]|uniref:hypothetical protein n=1 Tax=Winogradskyella sp. TaxID=1883156 RepID=UPI00263493FD|nr:hypothetical protein [Winogradskyella sp.]